MTSANMEQYEVHNFDSLKGVLYLARSIIGIKLTEALHSIYKSLALLSILSDWRMLLPLHVEYEAPTSVGVLLDCN